MGHYEEPPSTGPQISVPRSSLLSWALFFFSIGCAACGILAPQPGIEPTPAALEAQSLHHWTTREVPGISLLKSLLNLLQYCFCFMFWFFGREACGILAPRPGMEPASPASEVWSLNHWTAREVPWAHFNKVLTSLGFDFLLCHMGV